MAALLVERSYLTLPGASSPLLISRAPFRVLALGSASPSGTFPFNASTSNQNIEFSMVLSS